MSTAVASAGSSAVGATTFRDREKRNKGKIWWSNGIFFVSLHIFAVVGMMYLSPLSLLSWKTAVLCFISWQLASFGITIGYHRLWSHRAFTATTPLRIVLAWMGSMGFQGSIKWWVLRHRLHHRFTDSPTHDPYSATNGLWWSHCGWIFRKPVYPRMKLIERGDLEADPVVRFQHRYYVPIALFSGLVLPALIGSMWGDALGGLVWGGAVARLLIWHTTFCINSLAHWTGLQPYTEEVTAKGNYLLALLTSGEGNHNFHHAFPKDFRNGPHPADWDPTKWIISFLHKYTPLIPTLAKTPESAILSARARVHQHHATQLLSSVPASYRVKSKEDLPVWSRVEVLRRHGEWVGSDEEGIRRRVLLVLEGCVVDVGGYLDDHPGGRELMLSHAVAPLKGSFTKAPSTIPSSPTASAGPQKQRARSTSRNHLPTIPPRSSSPRPPFISFENLPISFRKRKPKMVREDSDTTSTGVVSPSSMWSSATTSAETSDIDDDQEESRDAKEEEGMDWTVPLTTNDPVEVGGREIDEAGFEIHLKDATKAFFGGMNNHSGAAKERMRCLRVARLE